MASYVPVVKNDTGGAILYVSLDDYNVPGRFKANPTLAAGDVQIVKDGGTAANLATLPSASPASSKFIKVTLSQAETNADNLTIVFSDQTNPPEWCDQIIAIQTAARHIDDLAYPATSGRSLDVSAAGGVTLSDGVAHGGTLGSSTATFALSRMNVTSQTANTPAVTYQGNGAGQGLLVTGGANAHGVEYVGGSVAGDGFYAHATLHGYGFRMEAADNGSSGERAGIYARGSNTSGGSGANFRGGDSATAIAGDGLVCTGYRDGSAAVLEVLVGTGDVNTTTGNCLFMNGQAGKGHPFLIKTNQSDPVNINQHGILIEASGFGSGINAIGGPTGAGFRGTGGSTSGYGMRLTATGVAINPEFQAAIADGILDRDMALGPDTTPSGATGRTPRQALRVLRNKWSISSGTLTVTKENDSTTSWQATVTGTTGADPITSVDPT